MSNLTIEQACDSSNWRWKKWDVRNDGMVFWRYLKLSRNNEYWTTWGNAIKLRDKTRQASTKYRLNNNEKQKERIRNWRIKNPDKIAARRKCPKFKKWKREYESNKIKTSPLYAMKVRARGRIYLAIKNNGYLKKSKTSDMLGCNWSELKSHLELRFSDGMTWDNRELWHVDHIVPLASANSEDDIIRLCHYSNLQPLWAQDNLRKGTKQ